MKKLYTRKKLKKALLNFYTNSGADLILRGERRPKYENIVELHSKYHIKFDVWFDIKSYIKNDIKKHSCSTTTK
ncbi:hypothetical protein [Sulfurimonas sp.]|uniref:hypothetical protein n=1 Tax=Sulfurimonas sp. TaxID=2022749 RepID=UPI0025DE461D|nr:hypothetical protein [Sulfurimonas sp.]